MIEIYYQDEDIIVVNKPPNLLVHKNAKLNNDKESLLSLLKKQTELYLYPIHRIDRPVSGIVIFALKPEVVSLFQAIWKTDKVKKTYTALIRGEYESAGSLDFELKSPKGHYQDALTIYSPKENFPQATLMEIEIKTGRFHQIRRHFARTVNHVLGDRTHGKGKYNNHYRDNYNLMRIFLHSSTFKFEHPVTKKVITIHSPLPQDLQLVLDKLRQDNLNKEL